MTNLSIYRERKLRSSNILLSMFHATMSIGMSSQSLMESIIHYHVQNICTLSTNYKFKRTKTCTVKLKMGTFQHCYNNLTNFLLLKLSLNGANNKRCTACLFQVTAFGQDVSKMLPPRARSLGIIEVFRRYNTIHEYKR